MAYIKISTGTYPLSERDIRAAHPNTSFPVPFQAPDDYAWVFPTPQPTYDAITQSVAEGAPTQQGGNWVQTWVVTDLDQPTVDANVEAAKDRLQEAATAKRWGVMTGGMTVGGMQVGTTIDDQNRITSVVANAELAGLTDESLVDFKANSGWVQISIGQVKALAGAIGQFVQACYTAERAHHDAIVLLTTPAEVTAYDVNTGWPSN